MKKILIHEQKTLPLHPGNRKGQSMKATIDFGGNKISGIFWKMLIPTLLGMLFSTAFIITDGIFVGKGIGSDALAAVNITVPLFLLNTSFAMMFGAGASVVASIHLSRGQKKNARINVTQATVILVLLLLAIWIPVCFYAPEVAVLLGSSDRLLPLTLEYIYWFVPFLVFSAMLTLGMYFIRIDGSPNYAMVCNAIPAIINIVLDYVFIFKCHWGMFGAALATSLGYIVGAVMVVVYLFEKKSSIRFIRIKITRRSMELTWRNIRYICRLGSATFLCEAAIACMMLTGNYVFMRNLGEDGVAAYSVTCYLFPLIFMLNNAIGQSAQPIMSYNFGAGNHSRVREALRIALATACVSGAGITALQGFCSPQMAGLFLVEGTNAYEIAVHGLPLFASGYLCFAVNIIAICYFQSVERAKPSTVITLLRGFVFMIASFLILPPLMGDDGIWLAVPAAETLTFLYVVVYALRLKAKTRHNPTDTK